MTYLGRDGGAGEDVLRACGNTVVANPSITSWPRPSGLAFSFACCYFMMFCVSYVQFREWKMKLNSGRERGKLRLWLSQTPKLQQHDGS